MTNGIETINIEKNKLKKNYADEIQKGESLNPVSINKLHDIGMEIKQLSTKSDEISKNKIN